MKTLRNFAPLAALALVGAATAETGTVTVSASLDYAGLNWTKNLSVPKFDNSLLQLDSVDIAFKGGVRGKLQVENLDEEAVPYTSTVCYQLDLLSPTNASLIGVHPICDKRNETLAAYDGITDFAGASGRTYDPAPANLTGSKTLTGSDLAAFTGTGNVNLPVSAKVTSKVVTDGNFRTVIRSEAAAEIVLTYHYSFERASVGDRVWVDKNKNGVQDAGEANVAGVTVTLLDKSGAVVATQTTDANGKYLFTGLMPGEYQVKFTPPAGAVFTSVNAGGDAATDSDAGVDGLTAKFVLHSGEARTDVDAGLVGNQSLGDRVWLDKNGNGLQDAGESGVGGVTVTLLDANGATVATTTTDSNGKYLFSDLFAGDYKVKFTAPSGTAFTTQSAGGSDVDSDAGTDGLTANVTLAPGQNRTDVDAGLVGAQSLGDRVWFDTNANGKQDAGELGVANVGVTLLDANGNVVAEASTDKDGLYLFTGLLPGSYKVRFDRPAGYVFSPQSAGGDAALDSDASTTDGTTGAISLAAGDNRRDIDAGMYGLVSLGDRVWFDANANGKQDDDEKGVANVEVKLLDVSGNVLLTTKTDANGNYLFDEIMPGQYRVQFSKPNGYSYTVADAGADDTIDSDVDGGGLSPIVNVTSDRLDVDAGLVGTLCLGDRVWYDTDRDGFQENCEPGAKDVVVRLRDLNGNVLAETKTDANGYYKFTNLAPGDYTVEFVAPSGYGFTKQFAKYNNVAYPAYDSNVDVQTGAATVTLAANDATIDAGLIGALKIGDTVWKDSDGDGKYEPEIGEQGIPCVTVILVGDTNGDGWPDTWATTKTDKDGHYLFLGLKPGTYSVTVNPYDIPSKLVPSYDLDGIGSKHTAIGRLTTTDRLDFDFGYKPVTPTNCGGSHNWWCSNPTKWSCDWLWIGGKCHTKTTICNWFKKADCGDKSICLYQRLCAAKLNVADLCNSGAVYTCGKLTCTVKEAIRRCDAWIAKYPAGCNVKSTGAEWASICDAYGILDKYCSGR